MIPLYILGLLQRSGPMHGYQIKKTIAEQAADFTQIKLPVIYYHLKQMEKKDLLRTTTEPGDRAKKQIYTAKDKGLASFKNMLGELLKFEYRPIFLADSLFFFSEHLQKTDLIENRGSISAG